MNNKGMTTVELLCILAILSILSGQILPKLTMLEQSKLDYETACLVADLRWMQQRSRNMQWNDLRFAGTNPELQPVLHINSDSYYVVMQKVVKQHELADGIRIYMNQSTIKFTVDGHMTTPMTLQVRKGADCRLVIIDRVGRIRVQRN